MSTHNALQKSIQYTNAMPLPASPEPYHDGFNSDDLIPTSELDADEHKATATNDLVIVGSYQHRITLGRGGSCTVKIGRRNRQISRTHVAIEYNGRFELVVLGLNGATVDRILYRQHERAPLDDYSFVDILGDTLIFRTPPPLLQQQEQSATITKDTMTESEQQQQEEEDVMNQQQQQQQQQQQDVMEQQQQQEEVVMEQQQEEVVTERQQEVQCVMEQQHTLDESVKQEESLQQVDDSIHPSSHEPIETPSDDKENQPEEDTTDYAENIIDILVFSRKSSMPISDICSRIIKTNPNYKKQDRAMWTSRIERVLKEKSFFGEIVRKGKTADGSPKENLYYYNSDMDPVEWRRATYTQVGRSARKCTLQDKQYFWRIPPKLGKNRHAYIPPPAAPLQEKRKSDHLDDEDVKKQKTGLV
ncbi:hypothetical protein BC941DRAFT_505227 [Chlamydoabsidia padenii]|nr:hypothetical protein BC941DRAFT_505227 [Chlamydoabsidia padenii]